MVEGGDLVAAGLAAGARPQAVFVRADSAAHAAVQTDPAFAGLPVFPVSDAVAAHMTSLETPPDMLAVFPQLQPAPLAQLADVAALEGHEAFAGYVALTDEAAALAGNLLVVYADHLADPGNLGTLIRAAAAFGAAALVTSPASADMLSPKVVRASMGAVFALPLYADLELSEVVAELSGAGAQNGASESNGARAQNGTRTSSKPNAPNGPRVYGLAAHGGQRIDEATLTRPALLCVGAERAGLSPQVRAMLDEVLTIPLAGSAAVGVGGEGEEAAGVESLSVGVESLNAGVAGAIALYEFSRQRAAGAKAAHEPVSTSIRSTDG